MTENINRLVLGDNLEILKQLESETVDLIYFDPPFFSNRNYEVIWGDEGEVRSFQDRWSGGIDHYIAWLKERVIEMHRILKPTGSIFLHCDWHADAYIRVEILDRIFGKNNFRNEIIWHYGQRTDTYKSHLSRKHDTIFLYGKSDNFILKQTSIVWNKEEFIQKRHDVKIDEEGREFIWTDGGKGKGRYKRFVDDVLKEGKPLDDVWEIPLLNSAAKERIGYPTQKPIALMQRILEAASNENDLVLDPFVGGGTTVAVAEKLNRKWIGIDQSVQAIKVTEMRLQNQMDLFSKPFIVQLHKYDYDMLRFKDAFKFENWIIVQYGGTSNSKQRSDFGLDGKTKDNTPIQVKRSDNIGRNVIDNFHSAVMRYDKNLYEKNMTEMKPVGYIIAFSFGKGAIQEVARLHNQENVIIQLVTVEDIVPIAKKPTLTVELSDKSTDSKGQHEIEFKATGQSAAGIEFYSWDFDYKDTSFKAEILLDKKGEQTRKLKAGVHNIAVKVVDNDGLENIEVIKLRVNGKVERQ